MHDAEHNERVQKQAEHNAREAREKTIREEMTRLERAEDGRAGETENVARATASRRDAGAVRDTAEGPPRT